MTDTGAPIGGRALSTLRRLVDRALPWLLALFVFVTSLLGPMMPAFMSYVPSSVYLSSGGNSWTDPALEPADPAPEAANPTAESADATLGPADPTLEAADPAPETASPVPEGADPFDPAVLATALACAIAVLLARRWFWPVALFAAVAWLAWTMMPAVMVAAFYAATTLRRRAALFTFAAAAATVVFVPLPYSCAVYWGDYEVESVVAGGVVTALLIALPMFAGLWVNAGRHTLNELRERAELREREQHARAEAARAQERARIAREMHDIVAHRVSLMVLHAGALEVNAVDPRTARAADLIRTTGREALAELRAVLGMLRGTDAGVPSGLLAAAATGPAEPSGSPGAAGPLALGPAGSAPLAPLPVLGDLDRLVEQSSRAGLPVRRRDEGAVRALPATVERTAYRVVQEALTNVHKHAADANTDIVLRYGTDQLEVAVDSGAPRRPSGGLPGSGLGLVGLRERVELLGGTLHAGPRLDGGFTVRARIPVREAA